MLLECRGKLLDLSHANVMGVLNLTPDSFYDGGRFIEPAAAIDYARDMVAAGAAVIDVGGESTRPGAPPVEVAVELERVIPVIEQLSVELPVPVSIDTSKPEVMYAAVEAGAGLINDVCALRRPGALEAAAACGVPVCLMHMQGEPRTMQLDPHYEDVVAEVCTFLQERVSACIAAGIPRSQVIVDPGFGFGKTLAHNLTLLHELHTVVGLGQPVLVGMSRKSMIGGVLNAQLEARLPGGIAAAVIARWQGAHIVRTHDVKPTADALRFTDATLRPDTRMPEPKRPDDRIPGAH